MQQEQGSIQAKTILAVEDDADIAALLIGVISQATPHYLVLATHPVQALEIAPKIMPVLLILNYQLPELNGIELYDRLHAMQELAHVPAIMMSAVLPEHEVKQRGLVGMKKPFDLSALLHTIAQLTAD